METLTLNQKKVSLSSNTLHNFVPAIKKCCTLLPVYPYSVRSVILKLPSNLSQGLLAAWVRASTNNIWVAAICSTFKELASATTELGQLPSAQQLGSWHMPLGCLTFSHPHQQKTAEVVFKSCTHPHAHWWLWDSAHSTSLVNVSY